MLGLSIENISVSTKSGKSLLNHISLDFQDNCIYALRGANGCGKSTLVNAIMGHPGYRTTAGQIRLDGHDISQLTTNQRVQKGLFLAMQYPSEIAGLATGLF